MSLQFILGNSGSGKTREAIAYTVEQAGKNPKRNYLFIVPEQFTLQTQKNLVSHAPGEAIMNIDVLSFKRLAYRVFDDLGIQNLQVLEETGKNLVLRKIAQEEQEKLTVLRPNISRIGYIEELKSLISEMVQYNVTPEQLQKYATSEQIPPAFSAKLKDIVTIYGAFNSYMQGNYITAEEILNLLILHVKESKLLADSVVVFDEFTGFTPIQNRLIFHMLPLVSEIKVIMSIDHKENFYNCAGEHELFYMTKKTIQSLSQMAREQKVEILEPMVTCQGDKKRFVNAQELYFMEQNLFRNTYQRKLGEITNLHITSLKDAREELLYVAREINELVQKKKYRYKDIAVVTGAVDVYGKYVKEVFDKYKIAYFLDETTEILFHPFIEFVRAVLEVIAEDYSYETVFRMLRSGFLPLEEEKIDLLENFVLAMHIRGHKKWQNPWKKNPKNEKRYDWEMLQELREYIFAKVEPVYRAFHEKKDVKTCIITLYQLFVDINVEQQLWDMEQQYLESGEQAKAKEYGQIYRIIMELFEKYVKLLGEEVLDITGFTEILDAGLSAAQVASIPPGYDSVTIGDIERTRLDDVKILFFVGVNDGIVPKSAERGGIISEFERELMHSMQLELAPGAREQAFIQRFYLYRNLTKPSEQLYLSFARVDTEGKKIRPSYLIATIHKIFPDLEIAEIESIYEIINTSTPQAAFDYLIHGPKDNMWYGIAEYFMEQEKKSDVQETVSIPISKILKAPYQIYEPQKISRIVAERLYGTNIKGSVTRLERFASCAYQHFLQYGLLLQERRQGTFEKLDMGNIYHTALEKYSHKLEENHFSWFTISDENREEISKQAFAETLREYSAMELYDSAENEHMAKRMQDIFLTTTWALTKQVMHGQFEPSAFELSFSGVDDVDALKIKLENEKRYMQLTGRIDRLDTCDVDGRLYVKIIDYKSGNTQFDLLQVYQGLSLQLVMYMNVAMELMEKEHPNKQVLPGGILYYHIDEPMLEIKGADLAKDKKDMQEELLAQLRPDGLINDSPEVYLSMDQTIDGKSQVIPLTLKKDGTVSDRGSHVASTEEFQIIEEYVSAQVKWLGKQIYSGDVQVNPYKDKKKNSCEYCPYKGVCGFDIKIPGYKYRKLPEISKEEIISSMNRDTQIIEKQKE